MLMLSVGVGFIQMINFLFVKFGASDDVMKSNFKIVIMTLPLQIAASMAFAYFYSQGVKQDIPYAYLSLISFAASLLVSFLVSIFFLNMKLPSMNECFALVFTVIGISLFLYEK